MIAMEGHVVMRCVKTKTNRCRSVHQEDPSDTDQSTDLGFSRTITDLGTVSSGHLRA